MDIHELSLDWFRNHLVESPVRHNAAENGLNSVKTNLASQSMRHHLYFSRLSRPENGRKTSLVYDVEVCIVLHQDFRCMSLGCSRLLRSWRTPHQCFLHQLYNICVLQLWSKHWTSAHKESRYFYMLRQGPQQWKKLYNCNSFDPLSSKYLAIANARWIFWTLAYRVQFFFLQQKRLDSASQCPNDSPRTLPSKETHTSVWEKTLGFSNERTFVFFDKFSTTRGWLVSMIVGTVRSISKS